VADDRQHPEHPEHRAPDDSAGALWVEQHLDVATGQYQPALRFRDQVVRLTGKLAQGWARDVLDAAHSAAYDAAVFRQIREGLDMGREHAAAVVSELRADRPSRRTLEALPVALIPGVSAFTGQPFLILEWKGEQLGQWTVADARGHALHLQEALVVAEMDTAYYRLLRKRFDADEALASTMVHDLVRFRDPDTASGVAGAS